MSETPATVGAPPSVRSFWNHKVAFAAQKQWLWRWLNTLERHSDWPDVRQTLLRSHMFSSSPPMSHKHNICEIEQMNKMQRCDEASNLFKAHSEALRSSVLDAAHAFTTTFENNWFTKVTIELKIHPICTIWWAEQLMNYIKHTTITRICNFIVRHGLATCLCLLLFSNICKKAEAHSETTSSTLLRGHLEGHVAHVNHSLDWLPLGSKTGWSQDLPLSGKYLFVLVLGLSFGRCSTSILVTSTLWLSSGAAAACVVWCRQPVLTPPWSSFPHFEQPSFQASSVFHCFPLVELLEPWQQTAFARYLIMMTLTRVIANNHHGCTEIATKAPQQGAMVVP